MNKQWWERDFIYLVESSATQTYEEAFIEHLDDLKEPKVAYLGDPTDGAVSDYSSLNVQYDPVRYRFILRYRTSNSLPIEINNTSSDPVSGWGANIIGNTYRDGFGEIEFDSEFINIAQDAFSGQTALTQVEIPEYVETILDGAFAYCSGLTTCVVTDTLSNINSMAFYGCVSLMDFNMPFMLDTLGTMSFGSCTSLTSIYVPAGLSDAGIDIFSDCSAITEVLIGYGISEITDGMFKNCVSLEKISIPSSVSELGQNVFSGCSSLRNIKIRSLVAPSFTLSNTFLGVGWYGKLEYPNGSDYSSWLNETQHGLGYYKWNTDTIETVFVVTSTTVPTKIINVPEYVQFLEIDGVMVPVSGTGYTFSTTGEHTVKYALASSSSTYASAFTGCEDMVEVTIPTVNMYGDSNDVMNGMFEDCTGLVEVTIDGPTSIGEGAFKGCTSLEVVHISDDMSDMTSINIFSGCSSLSSITVSATTAPSVSDETFKDIAYGGILEYPAESDYDSWLLDVEYSLKAVYGWNSSPYERERLTFIAQQDNTTFRFVGVTSQAANNKLKYSVDDGETWVSLANNTDTTPIQSGETIMFAASGGGPTPTNVTTPTSTTTSIGPGHFTSSGEFIAEGNVMSIYYDNDFIVQKELPNTGSTMARLFDGCTGLTYAKNLVLPATTLRSSCYFKMFSGCTSLTDAPETIPATALTDYSCSYMYSNCQSLTGITELNADEMGAYSLQNMFEGCTSMVTPPDLDATKLAVGCYSYMFKGCSSMTSTPDLLVDDPTNGLPSKCYAGMFSGCSKVDSIKMLGRNKTGTTDCFTDWVNGVSGSGTFVKNGLLLTIPEDSINGIPLGWTFRATDETDYLVITAMDAGTTYVYFSGATRSKTIYGTTDNGYTWSSVSYNARLTLSSTGHKSAAFKQSGVKPDSTAGTSIPVSSSTIRSAGIGNFVIGNSTSNSGMSFAKSARVLGNPMSLYYGDDFYGENDLSTIPFAFCGLFLSNRLHTSTNIKLPAEKLSKCCYTGMFIGSTAMTSCPIENISATALTDGCYAYMFSGCTALTSGPDLPVTPLAVSCYEGMFYGCSALTAVPEMATASTLPVKCYDHMFYGCTGITSAPEMAATTVGASACSYMFCNCKSLVNVSDLSATTIGNHSYKSMFTNCTSLVTAPYISASTIPMSACASMFSGCTALTNVQASLTATSVGSSGYCHMFVGCKSLATPPQLPATALSQACYYGMFSGCTKIVTSPDLTVSAVPAYAYAYMFSDCTGLKSIQVNETNRELPCPSTGLSTASTACYMGMFQNCTGLTTTGCPTLPSQTVPESGYSLMFKGCTSLSEMPALTASTISDASYMCMFCGCTSLTVVKPLTATTVHDSTYESMFEGCSNTNFKIAPVVCANTFAERCYYKMFCDCTGLISAATSSHTGTLKLGATSSQLYNSCFAYMYSGCTSLKSVPTDYLPSTNLSKSCYQGMFYTCRSSAFTYTPQLSATTVYDSCYDHMFYGCRYLTTTQGSLPAQSLAKGCYRYMYYGCGDLTIGNAPDLPAKTLAEEAYMYMFAHCTGFTTIKPLTSVTTNTIPSACCYSMYMASGVREVPEAYLPATTIYAAGYAYMFSACTSLTGFTSTTGQSRLAATSLSAECYKGMFGSCSGLSVYPIISSTTIPYSGCYGTFSNCGIVTAKGVVADTVNTGGCGYMYSDCLSLTSVTTNFPAMTLETYCYYGMFSGCTKLKSVASDFLPATSIPDGGYGCMFYGCSSLTATPLLPATSIGTSAYSAMFYSCSTIQSSPSIVVNSIPAHACEGMFSKCTGLTSVGALQVSSIGSNGFAHMFDSCTTLQVPPVMTGVTSVAASGCLSMFAYCKSLTGTTSFPATSLSGACYRSMFYSCTTLTSVQPLPATTLTSGCYYSMFSYCANLTDAPALNATTLAASCYTNMFLGCISLTGAPSTLPTMSLTGASGCYSGMFWSCSALTSAPALPATALSSSCYAGMFRSCKNLTSAPVLPATELVSSCYYYMFYDCSGLSEVTCLATNGINQNSSTYSWLGSVASSGILHKNPSTPVGSGIPGKYWYTNNVNSIPAGWTYDDAS